MILCDARCIWSFFIHWRGSSSMSEGTSFGKTCGLTATKNTPTPDFFKLKSSHHRAAWIDPIISNTFNQGFVFERSFRWKGLKTKHHSYIQLKSNQCELNFKSSTWVIPCFWTSPHLVARQAEWAEYDSIPWQLLSQLPTQVAQWPNPLY